MRKNKKKVDNIFEIVLLSFGLIMPVVGYTQSKTTERGNSPNRQVQVMNNLNNKEDKKEDNKNNRAKGSSSNRENQNKGNDRR